MDHKDDTQNTNWTERPLFRDNQRLTPERLNRVHDHHAARLRMALLGIAGSGVVYGFDIDRDKERICKIKDGRIKIGCGLAIDCHGRQLYWPGGWIDVNKLCGELPTCADKYTLWVHYAERSTDSDGRCGCDEAEAEWVEEGVVFSLRKGCTPVCGVCPDHCCDCNDICDYVCGRTGAGDICVPEDKCLNNLCKDPPSLCPARCSDWFYDDSAGLQLARVEICKLTQGAMGCDPKFGFCLCKPEVCQYRSYVYRNPLLYELIRGCHIDLARVESVNFKNCDGLCFKDWMSSSETEPVKWEAFEKGLTCGFEVHFTKPIKTKTLNKSSLIFTALIQEYESLFLDTLRIPIDTITMLDEEKGCATCACIQFDKDWLERQIESDKKWPSRFNSGAIIEFTVRGAMLRDKCGCMLDGRPLDMPDDKPGQEMPGDDFIVSFCVAPKPRSGPKGGDDNSDIATSIQPD